MTTQPEQILESMKALIQRFFGISALSDCVKLCQNVTFCVTICQLWYILCTFAVLLDTTKRTKIALKSVLDTILPNNDNTPLLPLHDAHLRGFFIYSL